MLKEHKRGSTILIRFFKPQHIETGAYVHTYVVPVYSKRKSTYPFVKGNKKEDRKGKEREKKNEKKIC